MRCRLAGTLLLSQRAICIMLDRGSVLPLKRERFGGRNPKFAAMPRNAKLHWHLCSFIRQFSVWFRVVNYSCYSSAFERTLNCVIFLLLGMRHCLSGPVFPDFCLNKWISILYFKCVNDCIVRFSNEINSLPPPKGESYVFTRVCLFVCLSGLDWLGYSIS